MFSSLVYTEDSDNTNWLERIFSGMENILQDSWVYKKWTEQGVKRGMEQGRRQDIVSLVQKRFPSLTPLAQERVVLLTTPEKLQDLLLQIAVAKDEQEVCSSLLETTDEQKHWALNLRYMDQGLQRL